MVNQERLLTGRYLRRETTETTHSRVVNMNVCHVIVIVTSCTLHRVQSHFEIQYSTCTCLQTAMATEIRITAPADFHVHLRQGDMCNLVTPLVRHGGFKLAYVMVPHSFKYRYVLQQTKS